MDRGISNYPLQGVVSERAAIHLERFQSRPQAGKVAS